MTMHGAPTLARGPLGRLRSPTTAPELDAMRRCVWRDQGVVSIAIDDIPDPWLRQALVNEASRRWGPRSTNIGGQSHGR